MKKAVERFVRKKTGPDIFYIKKWILENGPKVVVLFRRLNKERSSNK